MVSLTYYDEHVAWQQRVHKEISQAHRFQSSFTDDLKKSQSPIKRSYNRSNTKTRARSSVYSNLPAANINMGAMNVYAEVRGKYSRNANKTINSLPQVSGIVSRPSTSGSLTSYARKFNPIEENKRLEPIEEVKKSSRPLKEETKIAVKGKKDENLIRQELKGKDNEKGEEGLQDLLVIDHDKEGAEDGDEMEGEENDVVDELKESENEEDRKTEVSFKTTSSQRRYIEELEMLLKQERIKRIEAEDKLQRISTSHSKRK